MQIVTRLGSCALQLILSAIPRYFMRSNLRSLGMISATCQSRLQQTHDPEQRQAFMTALDLVDSGPVKWAQFDRVLVNLEAGIGKAYQDSGISDTARAQMEKKLLTTAEIPTALLPAIEDLFTRALPQLCDEMDDPAKLYFRDYTWLGLSDDKRTQRYAQEHPVDILTKMPLRKGARLRKCPRCGSYMDDAMPTNPAAVVAGGAASSSSSRGSGMPLWMASLQKSCLCGSRWMLMEVLE